MNLGRLRRLEKQVGAIEVVTIPPPSGPEIWLLLRFAQQFAYEPGSIYHTRAKHLQSNERFSVDDMERLCLYFDRWNPPFDLRPGISVLERGGNPFVELGFTLMSDRTILPPGYPHHCSPHNHVKVDALMALE